MKKYFLFVVLLLLSLCFMQQVSAAIVYDDFNDNAVDMTKWLTMPPISSEITPISFAENNGVLNFDGLSSKSQATLFSQTRLSGDFDVQIKWMDMQFQPGVNPDGMLGLAICGANQFCIDVEVHTTNENGVVTYGGNYHTENIRQDAQPVSVNAGSGYLRISRQDSVFKTYFSSDNNNWTPLLTFNYDTADVRFQIEGWKGNSTNHFHAAFDNVEYTGITLPSILGTIYDTKSPASPLAYVGVDLLPPSGQGGLGFCSDAQGNFRIGNVSPGNYILSAGGWSCGNDPVAAAYLRTLYSVDSSSGTFIGTNDPAQATVISVASGTETIGGINFYLAKGASITGIVNGAGGALLANVQVNVNGPGWGTGMCTDSSGRYTITGIPPGSDYRVSVGGPSNCTNGPVYAQMFYAGAGSTTPAWHSAYLFTLAAEQSVSDINFSGVVPAATVTGFVKDANNNLLAKVPVYVNGPGWGYGTCTEDNGAYTIQGIMPGTNYTVSAGGFSCNNGPVYGRVNYVGPNDTTTTQFTLASGQTQSDITVSGLTLAGIITGRVTNAAGTTGIGNVDVGHCDTNGMCINWTRTDGNGDYTLYATAGTWKILFNPQAAGGNYLQQWYNNKTSASTADSVSVTAGGTRDGINVRLAAGVRISGKVTNSLTAGIANVDVWAEDLNGNWAGGAGTDGQGNYTFTVAPVTYTVAFNPNRPNQAGGYYLSEWYDNRSNRNDREFITVSGDRTIDALLETGGAISGRVTGPSGTGGLAYVNVGYCDENGFCINWTQTDSLGDYRLVAPAGDWKIMFSPGGNYFPEWYNNQSSSNTAALVSVAVGTTRIGIDAQLETRPPIYVAGVIINSQGAPIIGARVEQAENPDIYATTDNNGSFTLNGLPAGVKFSLKMISAGYETEYSETMNVINNRTLPAPYPLLTPKEKALWNINANTSAIWGLVQYKQIHTPIANATVSCASTKYPAQCPYPITYYDGTNYGGTSTYQNGLFVIRNVEPGDTVTVTASKPGDLFTTGKTFLIHGDGISYSTIAANNNALTVTKVGLGTGPVYSSSGSITWNGNIGTANYSTDVLVNLTAGSDPGSIFSGWSGEGCSGTGACTVTMNGAKSVRAIFTTVASAATSSAVFKSQIPTVPDGSITINGSPLDWGTIQPMVSDSPTDSICVEPGTDIKNFYLAKDSNYLYWRVETSDGAFSFGTAADPRILVLLFYERNSSRGLTVNIGNPASGYVSARYDNNQDWTGLYGGSAYGTVGTVAEGKIPLAELAPFDIGYINAYYWKSSSGPQCDEAIRNFPLPVSITGAVTDSQGVPFAGARVEEAGNPNNFVTSANDGSFTLNGIPAGINFSLKIIADGKVTEYSESRSANNNFTFPYPHTLLTLAEMGPWNNSTGKSAIWGIVQYKQVHTTIAGAVVSCSSTKYPAQCPYTILCKDGSAYGGTSTYENGLFIIKNVDPGDTVTITASKPGTTFNSRIMLIHDDGISYTTIGADSTGTVSGIVTDAVGTPLANVPVNVSGPSWGRGACTNSLGAYTITTIPPGSDYRVSVGGPSNCSNGTVYGQVYYIGVNSTTPNWNSATAFTFALGETKSGINFSGLVQVAAISGTLQGDPAIGVQGLTVVLHDSQERLVNYSTTGQNGSFFFGNLAAGDYTIKVYDPFLNYLYAEQAVQVSLGTLINANITLTRLTPSGTNLPSFKTDPDLLVDPLVFVYRASDNNEYLNLGAEINDPSGNQPPSIKSVSVVDPAGKLHYLYHQKYQALVDQGVRYAEYWQNTRDNQLSNFATKVGDYTFTILDMEGNRVSKTVRLDSYSLNKMLRPMLTSPDNGSQVDPAVLTLTWGSVQGAAFYQVRILEGGEMIYKGHNDPSTSFTVPPGLLHPDRYYTWYIMAWNNGNPNYTDYVSISSSNSFYAQGATTPSSGSLTVKIIPWVSGSPLIPHDAYAGRPIRVKAVGKGGTPPYTYTWDFGDGTPQVTDTSSLNLGAKHLYNATSDKLFNATITVTDSAGASVSATYPVKFWASPSRAVKVNVAIDEALWWLHKQLVLYSSDGKDYGMISPWNYPAGTTAMALQALLLNGHKPDGDPNDPYTEDARRAKDYILSQLFPISIAPETVAGMTGDRNPDANGNGKGLYVKNGHRLYETGLVLMALSTLKDPTLVETVQDLVDYLAYAQVEPDAGGGRGGWRYDTNYRESDMSVTQFPLLGLEAAEHHMRTMGVSIPSYVKDELKNNFLYFIQNKEMGGSTLGGFGYSWPTSWANVAKTGAGMVGLALTAVPFNDTRVTSALQFINTHWDQAVRDQWNNEFYNIGDLYAMYAVMKGMKSYEIRGADTTHIGGHDWYDEYAQWAIEHQTENQQSNNGSWMSPVNSYGPYVDTCFGVLLLLPQVFDIGPTAVAQASPTQLEVWQSVTFSHGGSFHIDPSKSIVSYAWDFDGNGNADWTTSSLTGTKTYRFTTPGTYTVTLKVTDNAGLIGTDQVTITVSESTFAPVTIKIEPETFNLGAKGVFTASITLPENSSYNLSNIDVSSLRCEGAPVVDTNLAAKKLIVKFNVADLKGVTAGDKVTLTVTGTFKDGRPFKGFDTVRVLSKK